MNVPIYEERLQNDLNEIRDAVAQVARDVEASVKEAVHAIINDDHSAAARTIIKDNAINRKVRAIDKLCHGFVAKHLPSAGHLRFISSVLRLNIGLERVGDYASIICRETVQLDEPLDTHEQHEILRMSKDALQMLHQAIQSFNERNPDLAKGTMGYAYHLDRSLATIYDQLVAQGDRGTRSTSDLFSIMATCNAIERVSDQAKNICEETVFSVTGEVKQKKVYRILFLDGRDYLMAPLAQAIAQKIYPNSGIYSSAGIEAASSFHDHLSVFCQQAGLSVTKSSPDTADWSDAEWANFHVLVCLEGSVKETIKKAPFHTVVLDWDLKDYQPSGDDAADLKQLHGLLTAQIESLMIALRGVEDAT